MSSSTRDEVGRRVAERLGLHLYQPHLCPAGIPIAVWDALISAELQREQAEQRVEELTAERRAINAAWVLFYGSLPDGEYVGLGEMRTALGMPEAALSPKAKEPVK